MVVRREHVITLISSISLVLPVVVAAAAPVPGHIVPATCTGVNCTCDDLTKLAENILNAAIYFAVFVSAILFAWAGWKMLSGKSTGESNDIAKAKEILWNVMVGLVIMLAAWLIVDTLLRTLTSNQTWNTICPKRV